MDTIGWLKFYKYAIRFGFKKCPTIAEDFAGYCVARKLESGNNIIIKYAWVDFIRLNFGDTRFKPGKLKSRNLMGYKDLYSKPIIKLTVNITEPSDYLNMTKCLDERTKSCFDMYYVEGLTHPEIGDKIGVTESRVSQIMKQGNIKVRKHLQRGIYEQG